MSSFSRVYGRMPEFPSRGLFYTEINRPAPIADSMMQCAECSHPRSMAEYSIKELLRTDGGSVCKRCTMKRKAANLAQYAPSYAE